MASDPIAISPTSATAVPHLALYRRWRAQTFDQIVGQQAVVETLRNGVRLDRLGHGLLFVGPRGTGKTSMARIVAKAVNCLAPRDGEPCDTCTACVSIRDGRSLDVTELDAASNNKVDDMRELLPRVYTAPAELRRKVFIVDEVQRIKEGWDVLLKTLEEPPAGVLFIFCTTNPSGIRPAVVSRLQRFLFRPLTVEEIRGKLTRILAEDARSADPQALESIATLAAGGMRDAEAMLDQLLNSVDGALSAEDVRRLLGLGEPETVEAFLEALVAGDLPAGVGILDSLEAEGRDLTAFGDQLVARLRQALVGRMAAGESAGVGAFPVERLARAARQLATLDANRIAAGGYRFQLELVLFEAAADPSEPRSAARAVEPVRAPELAPLAEHSMPAKVAATPAPATDAPARRAAAPHPPVAPAVAATTVQVTTATVTVTATPATSAGDELARLIEGWSRVVDTVGRNPANRPLVAACRPLEIRDGRVILGFPEDQAFLRDIAERKRTVLEEAVQEILGRPAAVVCVATNLDAVARPVEAAPEIDLVEQARRIFGAEVPDVAEIR